VPDPRQRYQNSALIEFEDGFTAHRIPLRSEESTMNDIIMALVSIIPRAGPLNGAGLFQFPCGQTIEASWCARYETPGR